MLATVHAYVDDLVKNARLPQKSLDALPKNVQ
jgi:hypothetical protein